MTGSTPGSADAREPTREPRSHGSVVGARRAVGVLEQAGLALDAPRGNLAGLTARVESVKVLEGTWQVCTGMNYTGSCTTVGADSAEG